MAKIRLINLMHCSTNAFPFRSGPPLGYYNQRAMQAITKLLPS